MLRIKRLFNQKAAFKRGLTLLGVLFLSSNFALAGSWWCYKNGNWTKSNFSCKAGRYVAVLVHGWMQSHRDMSKLADALLNSSEDAHSNILAHQKNSSYGEVWCYDYDKSEQTISIAKEIYYDLIDFIKQPKELGFFAQGFGGLIVRYIHEQLYFPPEKCHTVFFGTPHFGISKNVRDELSRQMIPPPSQGVHPESVRSLSFSFNDSVSDFLEESAFLESLNGNSPQNPGHRDYYTIAGTSAEGVCFNNKEVGKAVQAIYCSSDARAVSDGLVKISSAENDVLKRVSFIWRDDPSHRKSFPCNHHLLVEDREVLSALKEWILYWRAGEYIKHEGKMIYQKKQDYNYVPEEEEEGVLFDYQWVLALKGSMPSGSLFTSKNGKKSKIIEVYAISNGKFILLELEQPIFDDETSPQSRAEYDPLKDGKSVKYVLNSAGKLVDIDRIRDQGLILDGTPVYILLNNQPRLIGLWSAQSDRINYLSLTDNLEITNAMIKSSVDK